jgi:hypothetical protein
MAKTLAEYAEWLETRDLIWPTPPKLIPVQAQASISPIKGIRAVTWNVYGTLLRIADGQLLHIPSQPLRLQVALEKTIEEFNMWNSISADEIRTAGRQDAAGRHAADWGRPVCGLGRDLAGADPPVAAEELHLRQIVLRERG